ncbi:hypothetical protein HYH03_016275 [Edaphochlamys debaryana]|uniref:Protein kinase domain-containing protein n=1 Tax=Edaphochlamys debaryana TaxID=47281 RepID=A0A835XJJ0_9CHLO|nr:hypothetical protein HYH03_016275 [Edaphochlamys debaryana]|eukprot:KAG2484981.1 hypothetical protein HYH03_016275 [Edaphochlamys debaryana]
MGNALCGARRPTSSLHEVAPDGDVLGEHDPQQLTEDLQLLLPIGAGAFGVVYQGVYQGAYVAVKLLVTGAGADKGSVREALVSPQLRHPNVVHTFVARGAALTDEFLAGAWGSTACPGGPPFRAMQEQPLPCFTSEDGLGDPRPARNAQEGWAEALARAGATPGKTLVLLVQEYCERGTLSHAVKQGRFRAAAGPDHPDWPQQDRVARRMLLRTAAEICRGMVHLHRANVIHGDLKPANVLLAKSAADRRGFTVKIADFGMTHLLQEDGGRCDSATWGTLAYASPESMNGEHTKASDGQERAAKLIYIRQNYGQGKRKGALFDEEVMLTLVEEEAEAEE